MVLDPCHGCHHNCLYLLAANAESRVVPWSTHGRMLSRREETLSFSTSSRIFSAENWSLLYNASLMGVANLSTLHLVSHLTKWTHCPAGCTPLEKNFKTLLYPGCMLFVEVDFILFAVDRPWLVTTGWCLPCRLGSVLFSQKDTFFGKLLLPAFQSSWSDKG